MLALCRALWFVGLCVGLAALPSSPANAQVLRPQADLNWSDIVWVPMQIGGRTVEKAVLAVDAEVDGLQRRALLQLDLGSNQTIIYGVPFRNAGGSADAINNNHLTISGTFAGFRFRSANFSFAKDAGDAPREGEPLELGTIGTDFFEDRLLLLDFVRSKLAIVGKGYSLRRSIEMNVNYVPLRYSHGKVFVAVRMGGKEETTIFYDTGSSALPIVTTRQRWEQLTGRIPGDKRNEVWRVGSWGKNAALEGAPMLDSFCVGQVCLKSPNIFFESSGLQNLDFANYPFPADGLIGNALFQDTFSIVIDLPHKRFGLTRGSLAGAQ